MEPAARRRRRRSIAGALRAGAIADRAAPAARGARGARCRSTASEADALRDHIVQALGRAADRAGDGRVVSRDPAHLPGDRRRRQRRCRAIAMRLHDTLGGDRGRVRDSRSRSAARRRARRRRGADGRATRGRAARARYRRRRAARRARASRRKRRGRFAMAPPIVGALWCRWSIGVPLDCAGRGQPPRPCGHRRGARRARSARTAAHAARRRGARCRIWSARAARWRPCGRR